MAVAHLFLDQFKGQFDQGLIDEIAEKANIKKFYAGETILNRGDFIRSTIIVTEGLLKVVRANDNEEGEYFMYYIKPNEACALSMMCATQFLPSEVKVEVEQDTTAIQIPINITEQWLGKYSTWYKYVIATYRSRFDEVLNTLDNVAFSALDERLEFYLRRVSKAQNTSVIETTHQNIAKDLNSSREVISRLLKKMEQAGLVQLSRNKIELL